MMFCMFVLTNLNAQNNYWNAQFTELTTGASVSVADVCGGTTYQLCISPNLTNVDCGNPTGSCSVFTAEVRDFCNPNEPTFINELVPMDMGALSSIWCGTISCKKKGVWGLFFGARNMIFLI